MGKTDRIKKKRKDTATPKQKPPRENEASNTKTAESGILGKRQGASHTDISPKKESSVPSLQDCDTEVNIFPSWTPWLVALVTLVFRVLYVISPENWWVLHPDEIFQSMEVAHTELYGYGFRPFEFTPPATGSNLSHYLLREKTLGMNAMRSPLYPQYFMLVSLVSSLFGFEGNPYLLWRVSHVVVTSGLPLAVYYYSFKVLKSHDTAALSAILVASSSLLSQLGTHTLVNSFISPAIFIVLARIYTVTRNVSKKDVCSEDVFHRNRSDADFVSNDDVARLRNCSSTNGQFSPKSNLLGQSKSFPLVGLDNNFVFSDNAADFVPKELDVNNCTTRKRGRKAGKQKCVETLNGQEHSYCQLYSEPPVSVTYQNREDGLGDLGYFSQQSSDSFSSRSSSSGSTDGFSFEDVLTTGSHSEDDESCDSRHSIRSADRNNARDSFHTISTSQRQIHKSSDAFKDVATGILTALCIIIRPDSVILIGLMCVLALPPRDFFRVLTSRRTVLMVLGCLLGILLASADDVYFYNAFVVSPFNWFKFNVLSNETSKLFGTSDSVFYLREVLLRTWALVGMSVFCVVNVLTSIGLKTRSALRRLSSNFEQFDDPKSTIHSQLNPTTQNHVCCFLIILTMYSYFGHKEPRFLHDGLVLLYIIVSDFIMTRCHIFLQCSRMCKTFVVCLLLAALFKSEISDFRSCDQSMSRKWPFTASQKGTDANQCLHYISQRNDVSGVYLDRNFHSTGGFSLLHKQVPVFARLQNEFLEFDSTSLIPLNRSCLLHSRQCTVQYYSLHSVSDLVHSSNSEHLIKRLLSSSKYNYAVVASDQDFFSPAFHKVFQTKTANVWRRSDDKTSKELLSKRAAKLPDTTSNSTLLEYEGEVLKQLGQYSKAVTRFSTIIGQGHAKASVYASLAYCLYRMDREKAMNAILNLCYKKFERASCQDGHLARVPNLWSVV